MRREKLRTLARSMIASGAATVTDLGVLTVLVSGLGVSARVASVPALLCAGVVNFIANRRYAFGVRGGDNLHRQAALFACVQAVTITLNAACFDVAMRMLPATPLYWLVRLAISNVVYLGWSFPMFRRLFRAQSKVGLTIAACSVRTAPPFQPLSLPSASPARTASPPPTSNGPSTSWG
jgi:putative flippase GtrA